jgi:hypothetical protein
MQVLVPGGDFKKRGMRFILAEYPDARSCLEASGLGVKKNRAPRREHPFEIKLYC